MGGSSAPGLAKILNQEITYFRLSLCNNSMDREDSWAIVHEGYKNQNTFSTHINLKNLNMTIVPIMNELRM